MFILLDETISIIIIVVPLLIALFVFLGVLLNYYHNPFKFPISEIEIDITGKRNIKIENLIDRLLIDEDIYKFEAHHIILCNWEKEQREKIKLIENKRLAKKREEQLNSILDYDREFYFLLTRIQTRYTQYNYMKTPYQAKIVVDKYHASYDYIIERYDRLKSINFEATIEEYNAKEQRRLMTPELRDYIMKRDNYTCQICGKYMPDGVGLQIDHIIPISKGGKSIKSNLQVLCSKCNGSKSSKID